MAMPCVNHGLCLLLVTSVSNTFHTSSYSQLSSQPLSDSYNILIKPQGLVIWARTHGQKMSELKWGRNYAPPHTHTLVPTLPDLNIVTDSLSKM